MNQSSTHYVNRSKKRQQINLIDLLVQLWHGKKTIAIWVIIGIVLSVGYIFIAKEKWTSTSIVTAPDAGQINSYSNAMNIMYGPAAPGLANIQQDFIQRFNAAFSALAETVNDREDKKVIDIEPAVKDQGLPIKISYVDQAPELAQRMLAETIQQVDDEVAKELRADLQMNIKARSAELQQMLTRQETIAKEQKDQRMAQINQALTVANQANIKLPQAQQAEQVSQDTMFLLGSDALASMVKNEQSRPLALSDDYYSTRQTLMAINALKIDDSELHFYRYVMKPKLPVRRDSPKRALTVAIGLFLGLMAGAGVVLTRNALRDHKANV